MSEEVPQPIPVKGQKLKDYEENVLGKGDFEGITLEMVKNNPEYKETQNNEIFKAMLLEAESENEEPEEEKPKTEDGGVEKKSEKDEVKIKAASKEEDVGLIGETGPLNVAKEATMQVLEDVEEKPEVSEVINTSVFNTSWKSHEVEFNQPVTEIDIDGMHFIDKDGREDMRDDSPFDENTKNGRFFNAFRARFIRPTVVKTRDIKDDAGVKMDEHNITFSSRHSVRIQKKNLLEYREASAIMPTEGEAFKINTRYPGNAPNGWSTYLPRASLHVIPSDLDSIFVKKEVRSRILRDNTEDFLDGISTGPHREMRVASRFSEKPSFDISREKIYNAASESHKKVKRVCGNVYMNPLRLADLHRGIAAHKYCFMKEKEYFGHKLSNKVTELLIGSLRGTATEDELDTFTRYKLKQHLYQREHLDVSPHGKVINARGDVSGVLERYKNDYRLSASIKRRSLMLGEMAMSGISPGTRSAFQMNALGREPQIVSTMSEITSASSGTFAKQVGSMFLGGKGHKFTLDFSSAMLDDQILKRFLCCLANLIVLPHRGIFSSDAMYKLWVGFFEQFYERHDVERSYGGTIKNDKILGAYSLADRVMQADFDIKEIGVPTKTFTYNAPGLRKPRVQDEKIHRTAIRNIVEKLKRKPYEKVETETIFPSNDADPLILPFGMPSHTVGAIQFGTERMYTHEMEEKAREMQSLFLEAITVFSQRSRSRDVARLFEDSFDSQLYLSASLSIVTHTMINASSLDGMMRYDEHDDYNLHTIETVLPMEGALSFLVYGIHSDDIELDEQDSTALLFKFHGDYPIGDLYSCYISMEYIITKMLSDALDEEDENFRKDIWRHIYRTKCVECVLGVLGGYFTSIDPESKERISLMLREHGRYLVEKVDLPNVFQRENHQDYFRPVMNYNEDTPEFVLDEDVKERFDGFFVDHEVFRAIPTEDGSMENERPGEAMEAGNFSKLHAHDIDVLRLEREQSEFPSYDLRNPIHAELLGVVDDEGEVAVDVGGFLIEYDLDGVGQQQMHTVRNHPNYEGDPTSFPTKANMGPGNFYPPLMIGIPYGSVYPDYIPFKYNEEVFRMSDRQQKAQSSEGARISHTNQNAKLRELSRNGRGRMVYNYRPLVSLEQNDFMRKNKFVGESYIKIHACVKTIPFITENRSKIQIYTEMEAPDKDDCVELMALMHMQRFEMSADLSYENILRFAKIITTTEFVEGKHNEFFGRNYVKISSVYSRFEFVKVDGFTDTVPVPDDFSFTEDRTYDNKEISIPKVKIPYRVEKGEHTTGRNDKDIIGQFNAFYDQRHFVPYVELYKHMVHSEGVDMEDTDFTENKVYETTRKVMGDGTPVSTLCNVAMRDEGEEFVQVGYLGRRAKNLQGTF